MHTWRTIRSAANRLTAPSAMLRQALCPVSSYSFFAIAALALSTILSPIASAQNRPGGGSSSRPSQPPRNFQPQQRLGNTPQHQEHLSQWMERHQNLNSQQQQRALEQEPGFRQLPQETQQRYRNRLQQLNQMPPDQRQRQLQRGEALERLSPQQRTQWRGAVQQLGSLPPDRRRAVASSFRNLRGLSPDQRRTMLNSDQYRQQFSPEERGALNNLLQAEPYPPQR